MQIRVRVKNWRLKESKKYLIRLKLNLLTGTKKMNKVTFYSSMPNIFINLLTELTISSTSGVVASTMAAYC